MPTDDPNAIPYPPDHGAEYRHLLGQFADVIQEIARFGWLVVRDATQGPPGGHAKIVGLACYRHLLEHVDGVSVLIRQGCDEPALPLLRSAVEALWAMEYIFENDSERRALAYHVERLQRERETLLKFDSTTPEGQRVRADLRRRLIIKPTEFFLSMPDQPSQTLVQDIDRKLQRQPLLPIAQEWSKRRLRHWFSLFGGPNSLRGLAIQLGQLETYEILYSDWSLSTHAKGSLRHIEVDADHNLTILGPREGGRPQLTTAEATIIALRATREIIDRFRPDQRPAYEGWYLDKIKGSYDVILSENQLIRTEV